MHILERYPVEDVVVSDAALKPYINMEPRLLIKSYGRHVAKFGATKIHLLERLANRLGVPGHVGRKHKIITSWSSGKYNKHMSLLMKSLVLIEERKKENPLQVLVRAIEKAAPRDETTTIEYGGARYPQAVDVSPLRRVNLALRWIIQGSYQKAFGKKTKMSEALAKEIMLAADGNMESYALSKKNDAEKQADAAR